MNVDRITRVNELLRREIAEALFLAIREPDFDPTAVTVTHVLTHRDLRQARVLVSVRGAPTDQARVLALLHKYRGAIQTRINRDLVLRFTPRLEFTLDESIARGDAVLSLLARMEPGPETGNAMTDRRRDPARDANEIAGGETP
jgi:ribosome-binding factor A